MVRVGRSYVRINNTSSPLFEVATKPAQHPATGQEPIRNFGPLVDSGVKARRVGDGVRKSRVQGNRPRIPDSYERRECGAG